MIHFIYTHILNRSFGSLWSSWCLAARPALQLGPCDPSHQVSASSSDPWEKAAGVPLRDQRGGGGTWPPDFDIRFAIGLFSTNPSPNQCLSLFCVPVELDTLFFCACRIVQCTFWPSKSGPKPGQKITQQPGDQRCGWMISIFSKTCLFWSLKAY